MKYAVVFDMDGVIVHTNPHHEEAFKKFFRKHKVSFDDTDFAKHMYGKHNSYIMSHFFGRSIHGEELTTLEDEKEAMFREIYRDFVDPVSGFTPFLQSLKHAGLSTGVATSAPRANLELITSTLGLSESMESMLASEDVKKHKPDPEIYQKSALNLGLPTEQCLVFEDSFSGITAARAAGAKVVGVLTSHHPDELPPCDHYIHDYNGLDVGLIDKIMQR